MVGLLKYPEVMGITGHSKNTIKRRMKKGVFPLPVKLPGDAPNSPPHWRPEDIYSYARGEWQPEQEAA